VQKKSGVDFTLKQRDKTIPSTTVPIAPPIYPSIVFFGERAISYLHPKILPKRKPQASFTKTKKMMQMNQNLLW
jgi:hypothetical protein